MAKSVKTVEVFSWHSPFDERIKAYGASPATSLGSVPTPLMYAIAGAFTKTGAVRGKGSEALYTAMQLRPEGVIDHQHHTAGDCKQASNHRGDLIKAGWVKPVVSGNVKRLYLTAKGVQVAYARGVTGDLAKLMAPGEKPVKAAQPKAPKAKRVTRARNAKPVPVAEPQAEPQAEPVPAELSQADQQLS